VRTRVWGREVLSLICLATTMIRWALTMAPLYAIHEPGLVGFMSAADFSLAPGACHNRPGVDLLSRSWSPAVGSGDGGDTMADTTPVIPVLVLAQRAFIAGIALTGIKGW